MATHGGARRQSGKMLPDCRRLLARLLALLALLLLIVGVHGRIGLNCGSQNPNGCTGLPSPDCPDCG
uniref:Uncharacterized protein n=1 Tax=Triticum urartu TaxID=4572 RepID=A0A8R7V566_TRIUA